MQTTDGALHRIFLEKVIRYDPPYYYEPYGENSEFAPTREKAVRLIAFVWRSEKTRVWLRTTVKGDVDWMVRRAVLQELASGWKDDPDTLPLLKDLARADADTFVRGAALQELERGWKDDPEVIGMLPELKAERS